MMRDKLIVAVIAVSFLLYLFAGSLNVSFPDFQDQNKAAERIAEGKVLYRDHISYLNVYHYPPVYLYTLGGLYHILGANPIGAKCLLAVCNLLAGYFLYLIGRDFLGRKGAFTALILFLANPLTISAVYTGYFDNFVMSFLLPSIYFLLHDKPILGGISLAVATMSKPFPVIILFIFIPFYLKRRQYNTLRRLLAAFTLSVALISSPFLVLCPHKFIHFAFAYNYERAVDSMSTYYYFLPQLTSHPIPLLLQAIFIGALSHKIFRADCNWYNLHYYTLLLFTGFFILNRINYPHYLIYTVPFFSLALVEQYLLKTTHTKHILTAFMGLLAGGGVWSYPWSQGIYDFKSSSYFWIGAGIYLIASLYLLVTLYHILRAKSEVNPNGRYS